MGSLHLTFQSVTVNLGAAGFPIYDFLLVSNSNIAFHGRMQGITLFSNRPSLAKFMAL